MRRAFTVVATAVTAGLVVAAVAAGSGTIRHSPASSGLINTDGIQGSGAIVLASNGVINAD
jgi:hypothetical protein